MTITAFGLTAVFVIVIVYTLYKITIPLLKLPFHIVKYLWNHKVFTVLLIGIVVFSGMFHDPANSLTFRDGAPGVIGYFLTGVANFFYGFWMAILHLCGNFAQIPGKIGDIGGVENLGGYVLATALYTTWAFAEAGVYWATNHLISVDFCVGVLFVIGGFIVLSGGAGGIIGAATKGGGGGGHGGGGHKGGGHHP